VRRSSLVGALLDCKMSGPVNKRALEKDILDFVTVCSVSDKLLRGTLIDLGQDAGYEDHLLFCSAGNDAAA
jgi:hypothetical protein